MVVENRGKVYHIYLDLTKWILDQGKKNSHVLPEVVHRILRCWMIVRMILLEKCWAEIQKKVMNYFLHCCRDQIKVFRDILYLLLNLQVENIVELF